jgi:ABC-2 type transport system ATP-binding protein
MMPGEIMLEIRHLQRRFRRNLALDDVNLTINQGELFGVLGPDGAGKTTLLRMMAAVMNPTAGTITVGGYDTVKEAEAVKALMGYMPQRFGLYGDLSVRENLHFVAEVFGVEGEERQQRMDELYAFTQLADFADRRARFLSGGMKKKLGLACALIHRPRVLLLDEPTTGVDPVARRDFWDLLSDLHAQGTTTVVSTPYMDEAERCNRVALLYQGRVMACETPANIKARIPGHVLAVQNDNIRVLQDALQGLPCLLEIQTYGDQLSLIVSGEIEAAKQAVHDRLTAQHIDPVRLEAVPIRMEEAFIYLVNKAREEEEITV